MSPTPFSWVRQTTPAIVVAGFITVLVGFTSSIALVFSAAHTLGADTAVISSWVWSLSIGMGVTTLGLSWWYKIPVITAWSTPGAALLITALAGYSLNEAIGAFIVSSVLIVLSGITGLFARFMDKIPRAIGAAMLGGILVQFGMQVFSAMETNLWLPLTLLLCYLVFKRWLPKYTIVIVLAAGVLFTIIDGSLQLSDIEIALAAPVFITPAFSWLAILSVSLPLYIVTMTSQNIPGVTVMRTFGYEPPTSASLSVTGGVGLLLAPFGCFALNLAAITAAICMTDDVDVNPEKRYIAGIWAGIFYIILGVFGATVAVAFAAFPAVFVSTLAGIALFATIGNSIHLALEDPHSREPALITFLVTASGVTLWGIGSAFWGIVVGVIALLFFTFRKEE